jgi:hypothetical protein
MKKYSELRESVPQSGHEKEYWLGIAAMMPPPRCHSCSTRRVTLVVPEVEALHM